MTTAERQEEVQRTAETLYSRTPDWVTFYREIFGLHGTIRHAFPTRDSLSEFEQTDAYLRIQHMLARLREQRSADANQEEPTRVITVRLPKSLHEALRIEAHEFHTSMNKLCVSKLLQFIDGEMIPSQM